MGRPRKKQFISRSLGYHGVGLGTLFEPVDKVGQICRDLSVQNGRVMREIHDGMVAVAATDRH